MILLVIYNRRKTYKVMQIEANQPRDKKEMKNICDDVLVLHTNPSDIKIFFENANVKNEEHENNSSDKSDVLTSHQTLKNKLSGKLSVKYSHLISTEEEAVDREMCNGCISNDNNINKDCSGVISFVNQNFTNDCPDGNSDNVTNPLDRNSNTSENIEPSNQSDSSSNKEDFDELERKRLNELSNAKSSEIPSPGKYLSNLQGGSVAIKFVIPPPSPKQTVNTTKPHNIETTNEPNVPTNTQTNDTSSHHGNDQDTTVDPDEETIDTLDDSYEDMFCCPLEFEMSDGDGIISEATFHQT